MADTAKICPHSAQSQEVAQGISKIWNNRIGAEIHKTENKSKRNPQIRKG